MSEPSVSGTPAPYGRACTNCARAKCRCIFREDGASCERCHRLRKDCSPSVSMRRRNARRAGGSRTAQLEEKLDDLVSMLRSQGPSAPPPPARLSLRDVARGFPTPGIPTPSNQSPTDGSASAGGGSQDGSGDVASTWNTLPNPTSILSRALNPDIFVDTRLAPVPMDSMVPYPATADERLEAERALHAFRTQFLPFFPCVHLPDSLDASELRAEKPYLWLGVMTVTCGDAPRQLAMGDTMQKILAQKTLVEHEKNMDLLLGLIVFLGWSQYHRKDKPYLSLYCQVLVSLTYDLGLNRAPGDTSAVICSKSFQQPKPPKVRTLEERRAVLASFHIVSQVAHTMRKMDALTWSPHMDECLAELSRNPETPLDTVLVAHIRIQLIADQIGRAPWQVHYTETPSASNTLPSLYFSALRARLDKVKADLPAEIQLSLLETALAKTPYSPNNPDFKRYQVLADIFAETRGWFDALFSLGFDDLPAVPFPLWCQMAHCLVSLYRLSMLEEPPWDRDAVRAEMDLLALCDRLAADFDALAGRRRLAAGLSPEAAASDLFVKSSRMLQSLRAGWEVELAGGTTDTGANNPSSTSAQDPPDQQDDFVDNVTTGPMAIPMRFPDDSWSVDTNWVTDIFNVSWE